MTHDNYREVIQSSNWSFENRLILFTVLLGLLHDAFGEFIFHFDKMHFSVLNENNNLDSNDR
jgi:hypothetical protein